MTMKEIYQSRKPALTQRIKESKSLYETGSVISETFETMQYQYLSQGDNDKLTDRLAQLMSMAKASFPIIESVNKTKMWETYKDGENQPKKKNPIPGLICLLMGLLAIGITIGYYMFLSDITMTQAANWLMFIGVGCLLILISGFMLFHRRKEKTKAVIEVSADADDIVKRLEGIVNSMDAALEQEKADMLQRQQEKDTSLNSDELDLFAFLLEGKYSNQQDFALEQLDEVEHYLAKQDVLLVPYSKGNEKYFEFFEGDEQKTMRPAMIRNGQVLRQGLAQVKAETVQQ